jgi:kumamolisin
MAEERVLVQGSERQAPAGAVSVGPAAPDQPIQVTIVVRPRAKPPDPASTAGVALSREEFAQRYGAAPDDVAAVERFASSFGLTVVAADLNRRSVVVSGTVKTVSAAFGATLHRYEQNGVAFLGRTGALSIPASLGPVVRGVHGIDNRPQARAHFRHIRRPHAASVSFTADQIGKLYGFPTDATGKGQTIALIELGGGYVPSDVDKYFRGLGLATPPLISVGVDGGSNSPTGDPTSADGEVLLDIEVAGALAPGATIVVYFAPNTDSGFLDAITTAVHDATNRPTIVSISWGGPESTWTQQSLTNYDQAFADAATLGVTVTAAAGDSGSSDGVTDGRAHVDFPSSSPHVLGCGGTSLRGSGITIASETVWNDGAGNGATGGGVSDAFALPSWQSGAGVPVSANPGGRVGRGVPDVAGDADPQTGYAIVVDGKNEILGGTSAVAPLWAGLVALLNERRGSALGFINAALYAHATAFRDITQGTNGAYSAASGWDACTGLGSPNGSALEIAFAGPARPGRGASRRGAP